MHLHPTEKYKYQIIHLIITEELFYETKVTRKNFGAFPIIIPSGSSAKLRIGCVVMFITSTGMDQDLHTNTSKYGV